MPLSFTNCAFAMVDKIYNLLVQSRIFKFQINWLF